MIKTFSPGRAKFRSINVASTRSTSSSVVAHGPINTGVTPHTSASLRNVTSFVVKPMMFASGRYSLIKRAAPPESDTATIVFYFIAFAAVIAACAIAFADTASWRSGASVFAR